MEIHVSRNGQKFGPYSLEEVKQYVASGQIQATDLGRYEGAVGWIPIRELLALIETPQDTEVFLNKGSSASFSPMLLVTLIVILIGLSIGAVILVTQIQPAKNQASQSAANESNIHLHATVESTIEGLVITNNDDSLYSNPRLIIHNGGLFSGGYSAHSRDISPHKSITIPWGSFTMTDGARFNYFKEKPTMVTMRVVTKDGEGVTGWQF